MAKRFTIETSKLLGVLDDLLVTADQKGGGDDPTFFGVHFKTTRGPWDEEPGDVDLLVGLSANGEVAGNTWVPGAGEIEEGFWSVTNIKNIKFVFAPLAKKFEKSDEGEEHVLEIVTDNGQVTIFEYKVDEPTELQFPVVPDGVFPAEGIAKWINGDISTNVPKDEDGNDAEDSNLTVWTPALALVMGVAKRRKSFLRLYRLNHPAGIHLAQIGETWRGAIKPSVPKLGEFDADKPDSDIFV